MTDLVKLALIAAVAPTLTSLGSLIASLRANTKIDKVEKGMNGLTDKLVKTTKEAAFEAGVKHEKENPS